MNVLIVGGSGLISAAIARELVTHYNRGRRGYEGPTGMVGLSDTSGQSERFGYPRRSSRRGRAARERRPVERRPSAAGGS